MSATVVGTTQTLVTPLLQTRPDIGWVSSPVLQGVLAGPQD
jgi:hypothetical protein